MAEQFTTTSPLPVDAPRVSDEKGAYLIAVLLILIGAVTTLVWGLPGLAMTALVLVPVMFVVLILISVGK